MYSFLINLIVSLSYVAVLYFSNTLQSQFKLSRDHPQVILFRVKRVVVLSGLWLLVVPYLWSLEVDSDWMTEYLEIGLIPGYCQGEWKLTQYLGNNGRVLYLLCILFCGPILNDIIENWTFFSIKGAIVDMNNIWSFRNYVFAPITEELFYTSFIIGTMQTYGETSMTKLIVLPTLYFGLAHVHHGWELYQKEQYTLPQIMISVLFQFTYTSLFGMFTNYVYLVSKGNLWSCILAHSFCNYMGLPSGASDRYSWWSKLYLALLVVGLVGFIQNLDLVQG